MNFLLVYETERIDLGAVDEPLYHETTGDIVNELDYPHSRYAPQLLRAPDDPTAA